MAGMRKTRLPCIVKHLKIDKKNCRIICTNSLLVSTNIIVSNLEKSSSNIINTIGRYMNNIMYVEEKQTNIKILSNSTT